MNILETERLRLRTLEQTDYDGLCGILQDADVMYAYEHAVTFVLEYCVSLITLIINLLSRLHKPLHHRPIWGYPLALAIKNIAPKDNILKQIPITHRTKEVFCRIPLA